MKIITLIKTTEEDTAATVEVQAFSKDAANIVITAGSLQEATNLLQAGTERALDAMRIWEPAEGAAEVPVEERPKERYRVAPVTVEEAQRRMESYGSTTVGRRFKRGLELATDFTLKHDKAQGWAASKMYYLMLTSYAGELFKAINNAYCYGFRRGYNAAIKKGGK